MKATFHSYFSFFAFFQYQFQLNMDGLQKKKDFANSGKIANHYVCL
ncbi:hypothetical protein SAMN04487891_11012 [Flagellimonas taeanensis]|jgi:hypothetical protein|uniref:Uncharacterized protein n=1 Tax=Flagellimonas taeanensis TaxID=1005926 RepID=A0A1M7B3N6_9FLAO|nr:hypothetical protein SAMN04487891_11012 [Allomuricauda taeanensis]SHL49625.1 hypothetical protein SAMN05216293_3568 [Allomuricauda taeanensis]